MMKRCFKCGQEKPLEAFYRHSKMGDGYLGKCKECTKKDVRLHREKNDSVREYDRQRYYTTPGRRERTAETSRRWNKLNPMGYKAHYIVSNAIRYGKLSKSPCEVCGNLDVHGHHDDYSKPLEVRWLCARHHALYHANAKSL